MICIGVTTRVLAAHLSMSRCRTSGSILLKRNAKMYARIYSTPVVECFELYKYNTMCLVAQNVTLYAGKSSKNLQGHQQSELGHPMESSHSKHFWTGIVVSIITALYSDLKLDFETNEHLALRLDFDSFKKF